MTGTAAMRSSTRHPETLDIRVDLIKKGRTTLKTEMRGNALELTRGNLARTLLAHPVSPRLTLPGTPWQAAMRFFGKQLAFHPKPVSGTANTRTGVAPSLLDRAAMQLVFPILRRINVGSLNVRMPDRREIVFGDAQATPQAAMRVTDYRAFRRIATGGDVGLGEAYTAGEWDTDDLPGLIQRLIENWHMVDEDAKAVRIGRWLGRLGHLRRGNTLRGSRRNISEHYDLGNDFFRLFLDANMQYSCAYYRDANETLAQAQHNKIRRLIERAGITAADHVLEIGCGWGGFAIEAVRQTGCRVTAITISQQQYQLARQRVREAGLADRIRVELRDYRTLDGQFDQIVSVEMIEAVGHAFLAPFFAVCDRVLKPGGTIVLQAITIPHERYEDYRNSVDWIRKHIFPGGHLPSVEILRAAMAQSTRLELVDAEDIAPHYARTLRDWRVRFEAAQEPLANMGFDQAFCRKWVYYFALCEASFQTRKLGLHHLVIKRAGESG